MSRTHDDRTDGSYGSLLNAEQRGRLVQGQIGLLRHIDPHHLKNCEGGIAGFDNSDLWRGGCKLAVPASRAGDCR